MIWTDFKNFNRHLKDMNPNGSWWSGLAFGALITIIIHTYMSYGVSLHLLFPSILVVGHYMISFMCYSMDEEQRRQEETEEM